MQFDAFSCGGGFWEKGPRDCTRRLTDGSGVEFPFTRWRILFPVTHLLCTQLLCQRSSATHSVYGDRCRLVSPKCLATFEHKYSQMNFWNFSTNIFWHLVKTTTAAWLIVNAVQIYRQVVAYPRTVRLPVKRLGNFPNHFAQPLLSFKIHPHPLKVTCGLLPTRYSLPPLKTRPL